MARSDKRRVETYEFTHALAYFSCWGFYHKIIIQTRIAYIAIKTYFAYIHGCLRWSRRVSTWITKINMRGRHDTMYCYNDLLDLKVAASFCVLLVGGWRNWCGTTHFFIPKTSILYTSNRVLAILMANWTQHLSYLPIDIRQLGAKCPKFVPTDYSYNVLEYKIYNCIQAQIALLLLR